MDNNSILMELRYQRIKKGLSLRRAAQELGISSSTLSGIETGHRSMTLDFLLEYTQFLNLDLHIEIPKLVQTDHYSLRLFDQELMLFSLSRYEDGSLNASVLWIDAEHAYLLPKGLDVSPLGILDWLSKRVIPKNREFVHEILCALKLDLNDLKGIIDICKGLSLNDSYWIVPEGFQESFLDYNLFHNQFSEILSLIAYTGYGSQVRAFTTSPELTTNGMLPKAWRTDSNGSIFLYKQGSSGLTYGGREPYMEYYAWQIGQTMNLNIVKYRLEKWKGSLSSVCALFTDEFHSYVPASRFKLHSFQDVKNWAEGFGSDFYEDFADMVVFDALILNEDRHLGNFGVIVDSKTNQILRFAPLFDHGVSLLSYIPKDKTRNFKSVCEYADTRVHKFGDFYTLASEVMGPRQKEKLKRLIGFSFEKNAEYGLPQKHVRYLERLIKSRLTQLLQLPNKR